MMSEPISAMAEIPQSPENTFKSALIALVGDCSFEGVLTVPVFDVSD